MNASKHTEDGYIYEPLLGSKTSIARQIGNAVPIPLSKAVGKHLEAHL